jgi:hypothetical protein
MGERSRFTSDDWQTLQFAPFWIFSALLGTYRNFDPLEYDAFSRSLETASVAPGRLVREVIDSVTTERGRLAKEFEADGRTIGRGLCAVAAVLSRAPGDEADMFKEMLISQVGASVARARGRYGQVISKDDAKTLELVAQFLT